MPPLECANFLECENKTVCVAPFDLPHGSSTICFSSHTRKLSHSPCWAAGLLIFFGQNGLECDSMWNYRRLRWELHLPHIPEYVIPDHFSQKKPKKKRWKRFIHRVRRFYGMHRSCRVWWFDSMSTSPAVECDALAGVRKNCGMRRIPSMRGWYIDHIGKFRGQNQNSNPKASPNFQGHTSGFYFSEFTLAWVRPRGRNLPIFTQPAFNNVTFDNPVLLR